jgi:juvenile-hormone esterase
MDEDVILITFQYRLGVLGFLSSEDGVIKGNMGMKDQIMALKWIQKYIKYFNGDPKRVLIFGNSSGGTAINQLMASPMGNGIKTHESLTFDLIL